MRGLFFTGTDTGVGKTYVAASVARCLRRQGRAVCVSKPVATGANWIDGQWVSDDTVHLAAAAGTPEERERITPWVFPEPVAPPVAAERQGTTLILPAVVRAVRNQSRPGAVLLVEGVGGLLCPLTTTATVADLVALLGLPLVVVARRSLGTLNHTLLTLEVAWRRGLSVAGLVVNETTPPDSLAEQTNVDELRRRIDVPLLTVVPHDPGADDLAAVAAVDWWALCKTAAKLSRSD